MRIGDISALLDDIPDVFVILCNTIMTAHIVCQMARRPHPTIWVLHEWWPEELLAENLRVRNIVGLTLDTIKQALREASQVVFVCEAQVPKHQSYFFLFLLLLDIIRHLQRILYAPDAGNSSVIYVGVPGAPPALGNGDSNGGNPAAEAKSDGGHVFTFLCLGIVCPRKNQVWGPGSAARHAAPPRLASRTR